MPIDPLLATVPLMVFAFGLKYVFKVMRFAIRADSTFLRLTFHLFLVAIFFSLVSFGTLLESFGPWGALGTALTLVSTILLGFVLLNVTLEIGIMHRGEREKPVAQADSEINSSEYQEMHSFISSNF